MKKVYIFLSLFLVSFCSFGFCFFYFEPEFTRNPFTDEIEDVDLVGVADVVYDSGTGSVSFVPYESNDDGGALWQMFIEYVFEPYDIYVYICLSILALLYAYKLFRYFAR